MGEWLIRALARPGMFIACVLLSTPLNAADDVSFAPVTDQVAATELPLSSPTVAYPYQIATKGKATLVATLSVKEITRSDAGTCADNSPDGCNLAWQVGSTSLKPGEQRLIRVKPSKPLTLKLVGNAPSLAIYVAEATLTPSGKDPISLSLRITRKLADFGTNPITVRDGSRFSSLENETIPVSVRNNATVPVDLTGWPLVTIFRDEGDAKYSTVVRKAEPCKKLSVDGTLPVQLAAVTRLVPGAEYKCDAAIPGLDSGKYRAEIDLPQANLPDPLPAAEFTVRWPCWAPILLLFAGAALGAFVADWQASGRRRTLQASVALDLRAKIRAWLANLKPDENPLSIDIGKSMVIDLNADISNLETVEEADFDDAIKTITDRFPILARFATLEKEFRARNGDPKQAEFEAARIAVQQNEVDANHKLTELEKNLPGSQKGAGPNLTAGHPVVFEHWTTLQNGAALRKRVRNIERALLAVSIIIAVLIGYQGLYAGNPTWGGPGDVLIALLTGIGATISGALTLTSLTTKYLLPQLGGRT